MKDQRPNAWKLHNRIDSLLNGGMIGIAVAGLLLAVLAGPQEAMLAKADASSVSFACACAPSSPLPS